MRVGRRDSSGALIIFVIVLLSMQVFLMVVALDGLLAREPQLAWVSAGLSILLFAGAWLFHGWLQDDR